MKRSMISALLLAATAASPLLAQDPGQWQGRGGDRGGEGRQHTAPEGQPAREDGRGRGQGQGQQAQPAQQAPRGPEARAPQAQPPQAQQQQQRQFQQRDDRGQPGRGEPGQQQRFDRGNDPRRGDQRPGNFTGRSPYDQRSPYDNPGNRAGNGRNDGRNWQGGPDRDGRGGRDGRDGRDGRPGGFDNRGGAYAGDRDRGDDRRWNSTWRSDRRYDWRGYRQSNRDIFRGGRYDAPRGWTYRRYSPGYRIAPFLFAQQYWIDDPYDYRLPPAYGSYRWVRYYDDVLLVDLRSGLVVDAIPNFFF